MQPEPNAKQLIVERIKSTANILVTVSRNPSVDELSAALGLTLMLNKMDKHATAVFSGAVPPAIEFLEPKKTFENTTDSLRDFIIALDKEKADRLRYKVEEDVVRIFITPYRTTITDKDLNFSQGDFNVELIIALGVEKREDIDTAVTAHGRILHDATVVTINTRNEKSSVSAIDWSDQSASSLCEMLMSLSEALQSGLLDQQMSTALLTGIVSATDRFRNEHTSPKVMTMAAQLMAAGANQQLIATKLEESHELDEVKAETASDGSKHLKEGESEKVSKDESTPDEETPVSKPKKDGEMTITHKKHQTESAQESEPSLESEQIPTLEPEPLPEPEQKPEEPTEPIVDEVQDAEAELAARLDAVAPLPMNDLKDDLLALGEAVVEKPDSPISDAKGNWRNRPTAAPAFGGTLNATVAHENERPQDDFSDNHTILSHNSPTQSMPPQFDQPAPAVDVLDLEPVVDNPLADAIKSEPDSLLSYEPTPEPHEASQEPAEVPEISPTPAAPMTLSELEAQAQASTSGNVDDARAAVDAALSALPFNPAGRPLQSVGAQPLGEEIRPVEVSPFEQPQPQVTPVMEPVPVAAPTLDIAPPPAPGMPPLPDFSTLPPLPGQAQQPPHPAMTDPSLSQDAIVTVPTDPGQFQIPGPKSA